MITTVWQKSPSGILSPIGNQTNKTRTDSETYLKIKEKAIELEQFYEESGVHIPEGCGLSKLIVSSKILSDAWLTGEIDELPNIHLWRSAHLTRVSDSIFTLKHEKELKLYLKKLTDGSLDLLQRDKSEAKNFLWELELLYILRSHGVSSKLKEPPDIVSTFKDTKIGIACKKVYSEKNFEKVLSNGVSQIEREYDFGIIAINIDDLAPADALFSCDSYKDMGNKISDINMTFLQKHERHFRKYLSSGRLLSCLVSTGVVADIKNERVRLNNGRQTTAWMIPGLSKEKELVFRDFHKQIMS